MLQLTAHLHAARGIAADWPQLLQACRDGFQCARGLDQLPQSAGFGPDELAALAGRMSRCANFGDVGGKHHLVDDEALNIRRRRCSALALHLHTAALAARKSLQADLFPDGHLGARPKRATA